MKPSKTIFLAFTLNKSAVADYFRALGAELVSRGYQIVEITPGRRHQLVSVGTNPAVYTWPSSRPTKLKDALFLFKLIREYQPVMILSNFVADNICLIVSWFMGVKLRLAYYHTSLNPYLQQGIRSLGWRGQVIRKILIYKLASMILTVSEAMSAECQSVYQVPARKISIFHNAIAKPAQFEEQSNIPSKNLLCVGGLTYGKGQDVLIRAMKIVHERFPSTKLTFLGEGDRRSELVDLADELGLAEVISFPGNVTHENVLFAMFQSYALIHPTRFEAFSYVTIEAMSVGTPVIASAVGGIPEIIRDGEEGFLVPPDAPGILAKRVITLLANPQLRNEMGRKAHQRFLEKFELIQAIKGQAEWMESKINSS